MRAMLIRTIALICILLYSCNPEKRLAKRCAKCPAVTEVITIIKDSVTVKETTKYDTLYKTINGPTVVVAGPCDKLCDENGKLKSFYQEKTKNGIKSVIKTDTTKNELIFDCKDDSLMLVNKEKTIEIERFKSEIKSIKETIKACDKEHRNKFDYICRYWFFISLGALLLWLGWKFKPTLLTLFKKLPL